MKNTLVVQHDGSRIPNPKFHKIFHFISRNFFLHGLKILKFSTYVKSHVVLLVDHFKILAGSISPEILKKAPVTSPTHDNALEGWCICRQPTIVVFRAGLYRQPLFKGRLMRILKSPYMFVSM